MADAKMAILKTGFLRSGLGGSGFSLKDTLIEQPRESSALYVLFPVKRNQVDSADKEKAALANRRLFAHVYQAVGSLIFAIANFDMIRDFSRTSELIERIDRNYKEKRARTPEIYREDRQLEEAIGKFRGMMTEVNDLAKQIAKHPERHDLCKKLSDLGQRYHQEVYIVLHDKYYGVSMNELYSSSPLFTVNIDQASFGSYEELMQYLSEGRVQGMDIENMRFYRAVVADIAIRLEPSARASSTFSSLISEVQPNHLDGVGLSITGNSRDKKTYLASLLEKLGESLRDRFETMRMSEGTIVFCPKYDHVEL